MAKKRKKGGDAIATNRRARYDYVFEETVEAGMALTGSEVKSMRDGNVQLKDSYAAVRDGEAWLVGAYIAPYQMAREGGHEPERTRKLLLHSAEIARLAARTQERGLTLVPIKMYWRGGKAKVLLGLGRGASRYDKREKIKAREMEREARRAMSYRGRR